MTANPASNSAGDPSAEARLDATFERLHRLSRTRPAPDYTERTQALDRLRAGLLARRDELVAAVSADYGHRSRQETLVSEVFVTLEAIKYTKRNLWRWMQPERRKTSLAFLPARSEVRFQPKGLVGIISPWNYPLQLALVPVVAAIGAGNRVMLKPSELTPQASTALGALLEAALGPELAGIATGGPEVGARFAALPFDHLFYTGSTHVGRLVMRAAAENLTPVTLELGGKSPTIVHRDFPLEQAAARIVTGKLFNAGQSCIAPDYVLAPREQLTSLAQAIAAAVATTYPRLVDNPDYSAIINDRHRERLEGYLEDARGKGARIEEVNPAGESFGADTDKLAPRILTEVDDGMRVMQEEIFGPLLPLVPYDRLDDAIDYVNARPRPLALYYFGRDRQRADHVLAATVSGGACINDTILQVAQDDLPFGGIGPSGMGAYHGREGFETFSHKRGVFLQSRISGARLLGPPYGPIGRILTKLLLR